MGLTIVIEAEETRICGPTNTTRDLPMWDYLPAQYPRGFRKSEVSRSD
jgi:hypothetical protein